MSGAIVIGSERSEAGLPAAMEILARGGSALDAVEAGLRGCEDNLDDHYVGTGGLPNAQGVVELDASLMIGSSRAFGAVGAVKGFPNPISIARAVLERLPQHSLLVGPGAELFAEEYGFERAELLTEESRKLFRAALQPSDESVEGERTAAQAGDELTGRPRSTWSTASRRTTARGGPSTSSRWTPRRAGRGRVHQRLSLEVPGKGGRLRASRRRKLRRRARRRRGLHRPRRAEHARPRQPAASSPTWPRARPAEACLAMLADAADLPDEYRAELRCLALTPDGRHGAAAGQTGSVYAVMTESVDRARVPPEEHAVKVYISSDMEGTAGVVDWDQCIGRRGGVPVLPELLTGEINAAIEGAMQAGAPSSWSTTRTRRWRI